MNLSQLVGEEKALLARLSDLLDMSRRGHIARFSPFLNERQASIAEAFIAQNGAGGAVLWGGYDAAVRRVAGFFPEWAEPDVDAFPVVGITVHLPKGANLTHRDYLGSLTALRIDRSSIGDILPGERLCNIFLTETVSGVVLDELTKIGRTGVRCESGASDLAATAPRFEERSGTVPSLRMDCLVSLLTGKAREKSAQMIRSELVQHNYVICESVSQQFAPGDTLTIRGYGKYIVDVVGAPTKKGRLPIACRKYA